MKNAKLLSIFTIALMSAITILTGCDEKPVQSAEAATESAAPDDTLTKAPVCKSTRVPKVDLMIPLPKRVRGVSTPVPMNEPNIAPPRAKGLERSVIKVPAGTVNLALKKPVTSNESLPVVGELDMVTDGEKSGEDGYNVDLGFGKKWVQIDLGERANVYGVSVWHYHRQLRAYRDVIVEVADDEDFT
jgi:hypothetical protein